MTSDEEKALFKTYGWEYDYIGRVWNSPDGDAQVTQDALVKYTDTCEGEKALRQWIVENGKHVFD